ncbi:MAG: two-component system activity regulator YycH [Clostridiales bacterium]|nr:two-component system activity regulator YycH [Clostridiales bacterium]
MKKERIKSIVLILLIITNLVLADKILADKKLWLSGYNFFANMRNNSRRNGTQIAESLAVPEKIIMNTGYQSSRFIYNRTSDNFNDIFNSAKEVLQTAFESKNIFSATNEDWYAVLSAQSLYLSYPCTFSSNIYAELIGVNSGELNLESFSDIAISDNGSVYINDASGIYRISIPSSGIGEIIKRAASEQTDEDAVINYSFDLNFDKDFGDQKTFLSPMILIYSSPFQAHTLKSENPVFKDDEVISRNVENILSAFSIAPNSVRRYTEADGSLVFVENNGILKISPQGILTFTASGTGLRFSQSNINDTYSISSKLAAFVDNVNNAAGINTDMCITSRLSETVPQLYTFDYLADGLPVKYTSGNAVSIEISGNYIKSYRQVLRNYIIQEQTAYSPMYIETLDRIIAKYQNSMKEIHINQMYPSYPDDLTEGEKNADWYIDIDNVLAQ